MPFASIQRAGDVCCRVRQVFVMRNGPHLQFSAQIQKPGTLIGVVSGSSHEFKARTLFPSDRIKTFPSTEAVVTALLFREVPGGLPAQAHVGLMDSSDIPAELEEVGEALAKENFGIAVPKGSVWENVLLRINAVIRSIPSWPLPAACKADQHKCGDYTCIEPYQRCATSRLLESC